MIIPFDNQGDTVELFKNQIPMMPRYCNEYTPSGKPESVNPCPPIPHPEDPTESWAFLSHYTTPKIPLEVLQSQALGRD